MAEVRGKPAAELLTEEAKLYFVNTINKILSISMHCKNLMIITAFDTSKYCHIVHK